MGAFVFRDGFGVCFAPFAVNRFQGPAGRIEGSGMGETGITDCHAPQDRRLDPIPILSRLDDDLAVKGCRTDGDSGHRDGGGCDPHATGGIKGKVADRRRQHVGFEHRFWRQ